MVCGICMSVCMCVQQAFGDTKRISIHDIKDVCRLHGCECDWNADVSHKVREKLGNFNRKFDTAVRARVLYLCNAGYRGRKQLNLFRHFVLLLRVTLQ